ncbi:MAG TPA: isocitrate lyase/phosphoenolpyruvate mutase family protein [Hanamia sp.]|nr:isocitrate lyase/phosphoenolpyruvate mutase family protein [Hanamia sp.]
MLKENIQPEKGKILYDLHHNGKLLILPNIWEVSGAALLENIGYPAVATSSSAVAISNGYDDGEKLPFNDLLHILRRIVSSVKVPVTADIESAYARDNATLQENIKKLINTGIAGINFEDSHHDEQKLIPMDKQCEKISLIKRVSLEMGASLFINARTDSYIKSKQLSKEEKLSEIIKRGKAYKEAGGDCLYPIFLKDKKDFQTIIKEVGLPVNILLQAGIPDFNELKETGVTRLSLGGNFIKFVIGAMKNVTEKLLNLDGMNDITQNSISTDYLKNLIKI